ncbi:MAG TPA: hypothetical protein EYO82_07545 [Gammaproteobacteria bacterium]|nr:hypothetical protein [Gammaproteobacteria bacterium]
MATKKIRQGDDVIVLTGRDKGKRGTVLRILSEGKQGESQRILIRFDSGR